jgi:vancomycin resistance protein YoaR
VLEASSLTRRRALRRRRERTRLTAFAVCVLLLALAAVPVARALLHLDATMPGVTVLGAGVSGLSAEEAGLRIRALTAERLRTPVPVTVDGERVEVAPAKLFLLDREATAAAAMAAGRESWSARARALLSPLTDPVDVAPVLVARPKAEARLGAAVARFATPPVSASVELQGVEPVVRPAKPGATGDLAALLRSVHDRVLAGSGAVELRFEPTEAAVGDAAAQAAADEARLMLSAPVRLTHGGAEIGVLSPERLASLMTFVEEESEVAVRLDGERLATLVDPAIGPYKTRAVNARIEVDGSRAYVVASQDGTALDAGAALLAVTAAARKPEGRVAALTVKPVPAELTTEKATALGIRERISSFTTEMGPSSENRIHNIHLMADYIDGTIVGPGETFSFNDRVGPRTAERGFREGQMIVGNLLVPAIGGGVCQTATTLFNNAFELGLPVGARQNHSFYISHYPMGRDAAVSWGGPDFSFTNDMGSALLIKASYTASTLTFTFYGTDEGRKVEARTGPQTNWREPKRTYALDPAAPPGSKRLVSGQRQRGFDVTVHRTVRKGGAVIREDSFTSHYVAVGDTEIYGPGSKIPGEYFVIPST